MVLYKNAEIEIGGKVDPDELQKAWNGVTMSVGANCDLSEIYDARRKITRLKIFPLGVAEISKAEISGDKAKLGTGKRIRLYGEIPKVDGKDGDTAFLEKNWSSRTKAARKNISVDIASNSEETTIDVIDWQQSVDTRRVDKIVHDFTESLRQMVVENNQTQAAQILSALGEKLREYISKHDIRKREAEGSRI